MHKAGNHTSSSRAECVALLRLYIREIVQGRKVSFHYEPTEDNIPV